MKQLALDLKDGNISLLDCPDPLVGKGEILIAGTCSLVSPGTERMLLDFGKGGWLSKARQQPEKLKQTINKIKTDGLAATFRAVQGKLGQPMPLGYSHVGKVMATGAGVIGFKKGDRVVSNGPHASMVVVPQNLCAVIPEGVSDEAAAFTVAGAIALQSIRLLQPTFGETIVVIGAGLIGQLTARLLLAHGCRVLVTDTNEERLKLLPEGIYSLAGKQAFASLSQVDGVVITAATADRQLLNQCALICRKRGRLILSGVAPIQLDRSLLYEKEIAFQVSCSYGPGRYDPAYEREGIDYPLGFVRWTAQRNFEAVLHALSQKQLQVEDLISLKAPVADAAEVYKRLQNPESQLLTALFTYEPQAAVKPFETDVPKPAKPAAGTKIGIAGAGQFTAGVILPILQQLKAPLKTIAGKGGFHAAALAKKFGIPQAVAGFDALLNDPEIGLVLIATPHQYHAEMAAQVLQAGKAVFLEKPMAIDRQGLTQIAATMATGAQPLYVGYNRRFAPLSQQIQAIWENLPQPPFIVYTVNAGRLPDRHWLNESGSGGRLTGEVCHFIDTCVFLQRALVRSVLAKSDAQENVTVLLTFENKAQAVIHYFVQGNSVFPKERIELHGLGRSLVLDNWRHLKGYGLKTGSSLMAAQDKGHKAQFTALMAKWPLHEELIPFAVLMNVARATLAVTESLEWGREVTIE